VLCRPECAIAARSVLIRTTQQAEGILSFAVKYTAQAQCCAEEGLKTNSELRLTRSNK
jgi:hypothetical protein